MSQEPQSASEPIPSPTTSEYEFTKGQNAVFRDLAENLSFLGWFIIALVVVFHVVLLIQWSSGKPPYAKFRLVQVLWPILVVFICAQFIRTSHAFMKVVQTQGSDITNLMKGLETLNEGFNWVNFLPRVWILFLLIGAVIGAIVGIVHWIGY